MIDELVDVVKEEVVSGVSLDDRRDIQRLQ